MKSVFVLEDIANARAWLVSIVGAVFPGVTISEASTIAQARKIISLHSFDLALIDIRIPDGNGIDLIPVLRHANPNICCVISTIFDDDESILRALQVGADGYLLKDQPETRLREHLARILCGEPPLSPRVALRILGHFRRPPTPQKQETRLSDREKEILTLVAKGLNRAEVATACNIGIRTVASHIGTIYRKLDITSRPEATVAAIRMGLIRT